MLRSDRTRIAGQTATERYQEYCRWLGDCQHDSGQRDTQQRIVYSDGMWQVQREPLYLREAASIAAPTTEETAAELATAAREILVVGMAASVVDRTAVCGELDAQLTTDALTRKLTGAPMTLREYTAIEAVIARFRHQHGPNQETNTG